MGLNRDDFPKLSELWKISETSVFVRPEHGPPVRITAMERAAGDYWDSYDELVEVTVKEGRIRVWAEADYAWAQGESAEECLRGAVRWVATNQKDRPTIGPE